MKVTLTKTHRHGGNLHPPGTELEVRPDQAERLFKAKKIQAPDKPKLASVKKGDD